MRKIGFLLSFCGGSFWFPPFFLFCNHNADASAVAFCLVVPTGEAQSLLLDPLSGGEVVGAVAVFVDHHVVCHGVGAVAGDELISADAGGSHLGEVVDLVGVSKVALDHHTAGADGEAGGDVGQGVGGAAHIIHIGVVVGQAAGGEYIHPGQQAVAVVIAGNIVQNQTVDLTAAVHGVVADHILGEIDAGQAAGKDPGSRVLVYVQNFHAVSQRGGADFAAIAADLAGELCSLQTLEGDGAVCGNVYSYQIAYLVGVGGALVVVRVAVSSQKGNGIGGVGGVIAVGVRLPGDLGDHTAALRGGGNGVGDSGYLARRPRSRETVSPRS